MTDFRVAVFASHEGTNLRALHRASLVPGTVYSPTLILSNNRDSGALSYARTHAIPAAHMSGLTHPDPVEQDAAICALLREHQVDLIVTAGYMKKIGPLTLASYAGQIINVHPSLLPRHGGQGMYGRAVHEAVLASGDPTTGPSVHLVTAEYDTGPVIARHELPVHPDDTVDSLASRVRAAEHHLLPAVVQDLAQRATSRPTPADSLRAPSAIRPTGRPRSTPELASQPLPDGRRSTAGNSGLPIHRL